MISVIHSPSKQVFRFRPTIVISDIRTNNSTNKAPSENKLRSHITNGICMVATFGVPGGPMKR
jgi:hypothetical protein